MFYFVASAPIQSLYLNHKLILFLISTFFKHHFSILESHLFGQLIFLESSCSVAFSVTFYR